MDTSLSVLFIVIAYVIGWFWGEEVRSYFRRMRIRRNERLLVLRRLGM